MDLVLSWLRHRGFSRSSPEIVLPDKNSMKYLKILYFNFDVADFLRC
jgi:hypothetical protein